MKTISLHMLNAVNHVNRRHNQKEFCDQEPCELLQRFIDFRLAMQDSDGELVQILVLQNPSPLGAPQPAIPALVTFQYCPFCGTRLIDNIDVVEWIKRRLN